MPGSVSDHAQEHARSRRLAGTLPPDSRPEQATEAGLCALIARNRKPGRAQQRVRSCPETRTKPPAGRQSPAWQLARTGSGSQIVPGSVSDHAQEHARSRRLAGTLLPDSPPEQAAEAGMCALDAQDRKPRCPCSMPDHAQKTAHSRQLAGILPPGSR